MRCIRLLLVLALALSVPLQGFAAASATLCDEQGHHDEAGFAASDHGHDHGPAAPLHSHEKPGEMTHDCPPCGASVAITTFAAVFPPLAASVAVDDPTPSFAPGAMPARLERPPLPL